jgi:large subunit ribosomal protein L25
MASASLSATPRSDTGKGVARTLRRDGKVPAVIYGHHREPQPLAVDARDLERLLDRVTGSTVIELDVDGSSRRTLIREVQRHPFKRHVLHVDFQELVAGEKVVVDVPLIYHGTPEGVRAGGVLDQVMHVITIKADPASIPDHIDVDVGGLAIGKPLHVSDLSLPAGVEVQAEESATVAVVSAPRTATEEALPAAAETAAEPELIRKPKEEDEA